MRKGQGNIGLTAAAFQDHLLKTYNLNESTNSKNLNKFTHGKSSKSKPVRSAKANATNEKKPQKLEYVLGDSKNKHLSLAEKLGIVDCCSPPNLTEKQWQEIKDASKQRNELSEPCPICKEYYSYTKQQVILSCSHVFHRKCISSFERFSGRKNCPICRFKNYETRIIFDGAIITSHKCATKIQSQWRRYIEQKRYSLIRQTIPPKDEKLRKEFYENKFLAICDKVSRSYDEHQMDVSQLIHNIDQNIESSRTIMKNFDISVTDELDWEVVQNDAARRDFCECPICLTVLKQGKETVLLSCSHIFHAQCLSSYEKFSESLNPICPVCRNVYSKKSYIF